MIEHLCSKKRMILFIIFLGLLTVLLLILEEALASKEHTPTPTPQTQSDKNAANIQNLENQSSNLDSEKIPEQPLSVLHSSNSAACWTKESSVIVKSCEPCSKFEISSKSPAICAETGLKESINCSISGLVYRSCSRVPDVERSRFVIFESLMLLVTILSYGLVKLRTSQLERIAAKQIEKRLATSY